MMMMVVEDGWGSRTESIKSVASKEWMGLLCELSLVSLASELFH